MDRDEHDRNGLHNADSVRQLRLVVVLRDIVVCDSVRLHMVPAASAPIATKGRLPL